MPDMMAPKSKKTRLRAPRTPMQIAESIAGHVNGLQPDQVAKVAAHLRVECPGLFVLDIKS